MRKKPTVQSMRDEVLKKAMQLLEVEQTGGINAVFFPHIGWLDSAAARN